MSKELAFYIVEKAQEEIANLTLRRCKSKVVLPRLQFFVIYPLPKAVFLLSIKSGRKKRKSFTKFNRCLKRLQNLSEPGCWEILREKTVSWEKIPRKTFQNYVIFFIVRSTCLWDDDIQGTVLWETLTGNVKLFKFSLLLSNDKIFLKWLLMHRIAKMLKTLWPQPRKIVIWSYIHLHQQERFLSADTTTASHENKKKKSSILLPIEDIWF